MRYILQVDFPIDGPFGEEMATQFSDLAKSINEEPGFLWKIWTENEATKEAGGIYAFDSYENAENYLNMHSERLKSMGVPNVNAKILATNDTLTQITHGRLD
ncbi:monooxygenase [Staphylococcus nepalensis]|uniref:monooxygenase n=1 Tax=Staphylococcus nepalensis TaxID=214473 RepID=UPI0032E92BCF